VRARRPGHLIAVACTALVVAAGTLAVVAVAGDDSAGSRCSAKLVFEPQAGATERAAVVRRVRGDDAVRSVRLLTPAEQLPQLGEQYPAIAKTMKVNPYAWELRVRLHDEDDGPRFVARYRALNLDGVKSVSVVGRSMPCAV
jgi:cell division protein FtsX